MKYKAVIFDLDGTLLNTLDDIGNAANQVLENHGYLAVSIDEYKTLIGNGADNLMKSATSGAVDGEEKAKMVSEFKSLYSKTCTKCTYIYKGISELLDWLDDNNIKYAVLSNKPHELTVKIIQYYFPGRPFLAIIGESAGKPKKPDPSNANQVIELFDCNANEVIFLGDSDVDMKTANNAGAFPVGVLWGFRSSEELLDNGAAKLIEHPVNLLQVFQDDGC